MATAGTGAGIAVAAGGTSITKEWLKIHAYADSLHDEFKPGPNLIQSLPGLCPPTPPEHFNENKMLNRIGITSSDGFLTAPTDIGYHIYRTNLKNPSLNLLAGALNTIPSQELRFVVDFVYTKPFNTLLQELVTIPSYKSLQYIYNLATAFDSAGKPFPGTNGWNKLGFEGEIFKDNTIQTPLLVVNPTTIWNNASQKCDTPLPSNNGYDLFCSPHTLILGKGKKLKKSTSKQPVHKAYGIVKDENTYFYVTSAKTGLFKQTLQQIKRFVTGKSRTFTELQGHIKELQLAQSGSPHNIIAKRAGDALQVLSCLELEDGAVFVTHDRLAVWLALYVGVPNIIYMNSKNPNNITYFKHKRFDEPEVRIKEAADAEADAEAAAAGAARKALEARAAAARAAARAAKAALGSTSKKRKVIEAGAGAAEVDVDVGMGSGAGAAAGAAARAAREEVLGAREEVLGAAEAAQAAVTRAVAAVDAVKRAAGAAADKQAINIAYNQIVKYCKYALPIIKFLQSSQNIAEVALKALAAREAKGVVAAREAENVAITKKEKAYITALNEYTKALNNLKNVYDTCAEIITFVNNMPKIVDYDVPTHTIYNPSIGLLRRIRSRRSKTLENTVLFTKTEFDVILEFMELDVTPLFGKLTDFKINIKTFLTQVKGLADNTYPYNKYVDAMEKLLPVEVDGVAASGAGRGGGLSNKKLTQSGGRSSIMLEKSITPSITPVITPKEQLAGEELKSIASTPLKEIGIGKGNTEPSTEPSTEITLTTKFGGTYTPGENDVMDDIFVRNVYYIISKIASLDDDVIESLKLKVPIIKELIADEFITKVMSLLLRINGISTAPEAVAPVASAIAPAEAQKGGTISQFIQKGGVLYGSSIFVYNTTQFLQFMEGINDYLEEYLSIEGGGASGAGVASGAGAASGAGGEVPTELSKVINTINTIHGVEDETPIAVHTDYVGISEEATYLVHLQDAINKANNSSREQRKVIRNLQPRYSNIFYEYIRPKCPDVAGDYNCKMKMLKQMIWHEYLTLVYEYENDYSTAATEDVLLTLETAAEAEKHAQARAEGIIPKKRIGAGETADVDMTGETAARANNKHIAADKLYILIQLIHNGAGTPSRKRKRGGYKKHKTRKTNKRRKHKKHRRTNKKRKNKQRRKHRTNKHRRTKKIKRTRRRKK